MKERGYPENYRESHLVFLVCHAWEKMVELDRAGTKSLHREKSWKKEERKLEREKVN